VANDAGLVVSGAQQRVLPLGVMRERGTTNSHSWPLCRKAPGCLPLLVVLPLEIIMAVSRVIWGGTRFDAMAWMLVDHSASGLVLLAAVLAVSWRSHRAQRTQAG
jgi:hypothetical protein